MKPKKIEFAQNLIDAQEADRPDIFQKEFGDIVELINQIKDIALAITPKENQRMLSALSKEIKWTNRDILQGRN